MFYSASSVIGRETDAVFFVVGGACVVLFLIIVVLAAYYVFRYNRNRNLKAEQIEGHAPLEFSLLGLSVALVLAMFFFGLRGYREIYRDFPKGDYTIKAFGQMWQWSFEYENGKTSGELFLPAGKTVVVKLNSRDVIHSFFIPAFRIKQDAVPGSEKTTWFVPDAEGRYDLFCTEYCGAGHSAMITRASVIPEAKFMEWLSAPALPPAAAAPVAGLKGPELAKKGEELYKTKGCSACHSVDGSKLIGPTFKGLYGRKEKVVTNGRQREVAIDDEYIKKSEYEPGADVVVGYQPVMPPQKGVLNDEDVKAIIEYLKTLK